MTAAGVAFGISFFLIKSRWNYLKLPELPRRPRTELHDITVIIPARNEAKNIGKLIKSLQHPEILVVDDASTDTTSQIARDAGAAVMQAPPLRKGVLGKPNACMAGARIPETKWLLFADADTWYEPDFLTSVMMHAEEQGLEMVSLFLRQECFSIVEKVLVPYAFALYFCGVKTENVNSLSSSEALANGQCLLVKRDAYLFMGGHGAVETSVIEDVALARVAKRHRMKMLVMRAEKLGHVRMYENFAAIWRGFEKNSFRFLMVNPWCGAQVVFASILLTSWIPVLWWLIREHRVWPAWGFGLLPLILLVPWFRSIIGILLSPFAVYGFQLVAVNAMISTTIGKKVLWKERRV